MAGLGYVLGGALQGLGSGLAAQGQADATQRREIALENLRTQNRRGEMVMDADLRDRNDARSTTRDTSKQITVGKANTSNQITVDTARTKNDIQLKTIDYRNQQQMARLNSALDTQRDASSQRLRQQMQSGEISETFEADDGQIWGLTKGGQRVATGVYFAPKTMTDGEDSSGLLASRAQGGAEVAPPAKPQPRTQPVGAKPAAQGGGAKPAPAKTYTSSEVRTVAKELGWSEDQVRQWARSNGYNLTK